MLILLLEMILIIISLYFELENRHRLIDYLELDVNGGRIRNIGAY